MTAIRGPAWPLQVPGSFPDPQGVNVARSLAPTGQKAGLSLGHRRRGASWGDSEEASLREQLNVAEEPTGQIRTLPPIGHRQATTLCFPFIPGTGPQGQGWSRHPLGLLRVPSCPLLRWRCSPKAHHCSLAEALPSSLQEQQPRRCGFFSFRVHTPLGSWYRFLGLGAKDAGPTAQGGHGHSESPGGILMQAPGHTWSAARGAHVGLFKPIRVCLEQLPLEDTPYPVLSLRHAHALPGPAHQTTEQALAFRLR